MSRKVCFTDNDGQIGTCTKDDEDCSTCGCIPEERRNKMTDEKICPIMSRPIVYHGWGDGVNYGEHGSSEFFEVTCLKEKCMAWVPECPRYKAALENDKNYCTPENCVDNYDRGYLECKGGCRLI